MFVCVSLACAACDAVPASLATPVLQPPLLNRPGMGAKLVSYYRKRDAADTGHQKLKQGEPPGMPAHSTGLARLWSLQLPHASLHGWGETGGCIFDFTGMWLAGCVQRRRSGGWALCSRWETMTTRPSWVSAAAILSMLG